MRRRARPGAGPTALTALTALVTVVLLVAGCAPREARGETGEPHGPAGEPKIVALVYNGPQGCDDCAPAVARALRSLPRPVEVEYVGPGTGRPLTAATLAGAQLYVQPGGGDDLAGTWRDLAGSADAVRNWVRAGGSYLGLCFGGYLAGHDPGFGLVPGDTYGYAGSPGAEVPDGRHTVVEVSWRGRARHLYFQDGPAVELRPGAGAEVLATYSTGAAAVVVAPYGQGRVGVSGPHPEAEQSWYDEHGLVNPDGVRLDLARELIERTLAR
ncbi:BPL-N domain-containing protein [Amycolatopsis sp. PS_44_ISF1]|uniref:BPL-N domain-containing protein n=1 Tax=Amycolatopsis sp. PS_44_ISF1 TaxID=2974917 RepID=UPI0028DE9426|nr:BPL-N domain-containing protein [Amycolatopsis sp. PS_44_ISF1]MDT8912442.1 BPL-N domain-containing protein [Amycolatopsis sp. PS_44_ISF1]